MGNGTTHSSRAPACFEMQLLLRDKPLVCSFVPGKKRAATWSCADGAPGAGKTKGIALAMELTRMKPRLHHGNQRASSPEAAAV